MNAEKHSSLFFVLSGCFCLFFFFLPFLKHIISIGNLTGSFLSILLIVYGAARQKIHMIVKKMYQHTLGKGILYVVIFLVCLTVGFSIPITICLFHAALRAPEKDSSDTAIVLGCAVHGKTPSRMLESRIQAAYGYLSSHPQAQAILSGGQGTGEQISEAQCMYGRLVDMGIDKRRLHMESASTDTAENIAFSMEILKTLDSDEQAVIITNEFHQYRAAHIGKKAGLRVSAVNGKTPWYLLPTYYIRELYAVMEVWFLS